MLICLVILTGCWDRLEISELGIVTSIAIDRDDTTGDYLVTSQYLRPLAESNFNPPPIPPSTLISTTGKTIEEALRKQNESVDREAFLAHTKVIIINEKLAKEGVLPLIDTFKRGKEVRGYVWLCIAEETAAKELLDKKANQLARITGDYLNRLIEHHDDISGQFTKHHFYKLVLEEGIDPITGVLSLQTSPSDSIEHIFYSGKAVFKDDVLKGILKHREQDGYHWAMGISPAKHAAITLPSLIEKDKSVSIHVETITSQIKAIVTKQNDISFTIEINEKARLSEQMAAGEFETQEEQLNYFAHLEKENERLIEEDIHKMLDKVQKTYEADILGFGRVLQQEKPHVWNRVKDDWDAIYPEVPYTVNVNVNIEPKFVADPAKP
ncbi:Ger(x)C family spore germination protein [Salipaludibacillus agaradhaerens]|uniref:Ger(X)C family spore germination protein n=2 Tax=Salipaludibacillus agaradhaerens TaxID=76935 RepID=A0A9Q4B376_SALAG|nr:Ger(x)C family spore germination protein [Salipaludibacillus agaradhaerens]MCR6113080.1 Ger(x)C family spore germination protein [Salipaludibacillus agaradhaerens]